jgi:hypothetical protein
LVAKKKSSGKRTTKKAQSRTLHVSLDSADDVIYGMTHFHFFRTLFSRAVTDAESTRLSRISKTQAARLDPLELSATNKDACQFPTP